MFCTSCGERINNNSNFCTKCGTSTDVGQKERKDEKKPIEVKVRHTEKTFKNQNSFQNTIFYRIMVYIILFLVLNVLLWGGQELWHYKDNKKLTQLKNQMEQLDQTNRTFENNMKVNGATETDYDQYSMRIDERNKLADEYNALSKSSGSRWYIIPIPIPTHK